MSGQFTYLKLFASADFSPHARSSFVTIVLDRKSDHWSIAVETVEKDGGSSSTHGGGFCWYRRGCNCARKSAIDRPRHLKT
ncbi:hypothetical protein [Microcoleus sp. B4-D4]|uniref:hypothetical protein n=1 Tax=Microcoleus sp. B4-D4 TaxID=2818667 RepID=UPI002FD27C35